LLRPTEAAELAFQVEGESYAVATESLKVSIIDFTLSRLEVEGEGGSEWTESARLNFLSA
jgi:hypothetical protein